MFKFNEIKNKNALRNVSDVPRSLQSWVSSVQSVVLTADVFHFVTKKNQIIIKNTK